MDVAMAVRHLDLKMAQMHLEMGESLGMSAGELLALAYLSVDGPLGPTELTHRLHITTGAMTAMLDRLADRDYVVREPHTTDRRRIMVTLTKSGRDRIFTQVHGMANEVVAIGRAPGRRKSRDRPLHRSARRRHLAAGPVTAGFPFSAAPGAGAEEEVI